MPILTGRTYRFCIWGRLGGASPLSAPVQIAMMSNRTSINTPAASASLTITQILQRMCLTNIQVATSGRFYFALRVGFTIGQYLLDDAALEYV